MHKLLPIEMPQKPSKKKRFITLPMIMGKFGLSLFIATREVFIGISITEVEIERIVRKRTLKTPSKGKVKVFEFD